MFLTQFQAIEVGPRLPQETLADVVRGLMEEASGEDLRDAFDRYSVGSEYIAQRQACVIPGGGQGDFTVTVFPEAVSGDPAGLDLTARMAAYRETVGEAFSKLYAHEADRPCDLIHTSCTGYLSPSPAQTFALSKSWNETAVTHSYHMGCYGAFPPVRMATGFLAAEPSKRRVDVVHTEFCTLHFDVTRHDPAHLINTTLFADGFIGYQVLRDQPPGRSLEWIASHEVLIPDSEDDMSWIPGAHGFDMTLARSVPVKIRNHVGPLVETLCEKGGIEFGPETLLAIHPGGPKILDHIERELGATPLQMALSHQVLRDHGNMSSATIPHVWQGLLEDPDIALGSHVVSLAFGPGLTATGIVFRVVEC